MPRYLKVAAAQLGAIPEGTTREQDEAALREGAAGADRLPPGLRGEGRAAPLRQTLTLATFIQESFTCSI